MRQFNPQGEYLKRVHDLLSKLRSFVRALLIIKRENGDNAKQFNFLRFHIISYYNCPINLLCTIGKNILLKFSTVVALNYFCIQ